MEHWEFLLQKDGDRSWLPLDSPDVEILEGRYRIVARSSWANAPVEVRISHVATEETPPKRRIQKRANRTSPDGLMVVIPFTRLQPGLWELQCASSDLMDDLVKGHSKYGLKLHVLPAEAEVDEYELDWSPAIEETTLVPSLPPEDANPPADDSAHTLVQTAASTAEIPQADIPEPAEPNEDFLPQVPASSWVEAPALSAAPPVSAEPIHDRFIPSSSDITQLFDAPIEQWRDLTEQLSDRLVDELWQDFDLDLTNEIPQPQPEHLAPENAPTAFIADNLSSLAIDFETASTRSDGAALPLLPDRVIATAYSIQLDSDVLIARRGQSLHLSGWVNIGSQSDASDPSGGEPSLADLPTAPDADSNPQKSSEAIAQELQLCLRDPQSQQILACDRQPLAQSTFPAVFSFTIALPSEATTRLMLGEVLLCGVLPHPSNAAAVLATTGFTITVNPTELIEELTRLNALTEDLKQEQIESVPDLSAALMQEDPLPSLELSFLDLDPIEPSVQKPAGLTFLAGHPLPPQLHQPDSTRTNSPQLPTFGTTRNQPPDAAVRDSSPAQGSDYPAEPAVCEADIPEETDPSAIETEPADLSSELSADDESAVQIEHSTALSNPIQEQDASIEETQDTTEPLEMTAEMVLDCSPEETITPEGELLRIGPEAPRQLLPAPPMEFQSLRLQERFFNRLTSIATDTELSLLLKGNPSQPPAPAPVPELVPASVPELAPAATGINPFGWAIGVTQDCEWLANEIVVDDEPPVSRQSADPPSRQAETLVELPTTLVLPEDDPVPTPNLQVTTGELVAGQAVNVRVTLPDLPPRIYVKLWINDRQTRLLLDGPRWLVDFLPNSRGELEAVLQLTVPFGSLEVRFEAIAVEVPTQRESHKVVVDRSVVPPDLPALAFDEFIA